MRYFEARHLIPWFLRCVTLAAAAAAAKNRDVYTN